MDVGGVRNESLGNLRLRKIRIFEKKKNVGIKVKLSGELAELKKWKKI